MARHKIICQKKSCRSGHEKNYSHIASVFAMYEDELSEKTMKTMTMKTMVAMKSITTWV